MVRISQNNIKHVYTKLSEGPGYYKVKKFISCGTESPSDEIPVSDCPINTDNDGINNNIDIDNDNDGITNCTVLWRQSNTCFKPIR
jgi:hypothetical protein